MESVGRERGSATGHRGPARAALTLEAVIQEHAVLSENGDAPVGLVYAGAMKAEAFGTELREHEMVAGEDRHRGPRDDAPHEILRVGPSIRTVLDEHGRRVPAVPRGLERRRL